MGNRKKRAGGEAELTRGRFELGDDRKGSTFKFRGEAGKGIAHEVTAVEAIQEDVDNGDAAAVGDFIVTRDGFEPQWWTRDSFLDQYEPA